MKLHTKSWHWKIEVFLECQFYSLTVNTVNGQTAREGESHSFGAPPTLIFIQCTSSRMCNLVQAMLTHISCTHTAYMVYVLHIMQPGQVGHTQHSIVTSYHMHSLLMLQKHHSFSYSLPKAGVLYVYVYTCKCELQCHNQWFPIQCLIFKKEPGKYLGINGKFLSKVNQCYIYM